MTFGIYIHYIYIYIYKCDQHFILPQMAAKCIQRALNRIFLYLKRQKSQFKGFIVVSDI